MLRRPSQQASEEIESVDSWLPEVDRVTPLTDEWLVGIPRTFHKGADTDIAVILPAFLDLIDPGAGQRVLEVGAGVMAIEPTRSARLSGCGYRHCATHVHRLEFRRCAPLGGDRI